MTLNMSIFAFGSAIGTAVGGIVVEIAGYNALGLCFPAFALFAAVLALGTNGLATNPRTCARRRTIGLTVTGITKGATDMLNRLSQSEHEEQQIIAEQARKVRALYPELFAALDERDRHIRQALNRIPHPADPETMVPPAEMERSITALRGLENGISKLSDATS